MADKILGIGSPLVDIIQKKDDRFIKEHQLIKGGMKLVDEKTSETVFRALDNPSRACGGSAMNTIKGMAGLENAAKFCGCIGDDELGNFIYQTLTAVNITAALYKTSAALTGRVIAVITPDDERSFATYLGAANKLTADMITDDLFTDTSFLYLEGYLI
ncbi:MAG TPA: PfkB family carbohydrate kinase, partial [Spirochaetota bacterium]|nr:PfkB family carbohydrate kinase [Spirochaetota bacterium]